jgi:hypothetical protein
MRTSKVKQVPAGDTPPVGEGAAAAAAPGNAPPQPQADDIAAADAGDAGSDPSDDPTAPSSGADKTPKPKPAGITKTGSRTWTVTKSLFQKWKDDPYQLGRIKDKGAGWEVRMVRQRPSYHLGIRGKDVILTVNGRKLDTNAQLMSAYLALQLKKKFDVEIVRNGKTRIHHYEIVSH